MLRMHTHLSNSQAKSGLVARTGIFPYTLVMPSGHTGGLRRCDEEAQAHRQGQGGASPGGSAGRTAACPEQATCPLPGQPRHDLDDPMPDSASRRCPSGPRTPCGRLLPGFAVGSATPHARRPALEGPQHYTCSPENLPNKLFELHVRSWRSSSGSSACPVWSPSHKSSFNSKSNIICGIL